MWMQHLRTVIIWPLNSSAASQQAFWTHFTPYYILLQQKLLLLPGFPLLILLIAAVHIPSCFFFYAFSSPDLNLVSTTLVVHSCVM